MLLLVFVVLGCRGEQGSGDGSRHAGSPAGEGAKVQESGDHVSDTKVIVTSDDASLPDGCNTRQIAELAIEFVEAFNRGDEERLSRLFFVSEGPSPPDFSESGYFQWSWYSVSEIGEYGRI